jgi:hypothetical protein
VNNDNQRAEINTSTVIAWPSGGRTWWAHFAFTRINIELTILRKKVEDLRTLGAFSAINGPNQQERSLASIRPVRTYVRSRVRRRHLTGRIPKNESGKHEDESAGLSGELLIGDDFLVARLGLGTMRLTGKGIWGEPADRGEAVRVVRRAVELGVNFIDTADSYGPGVSEEIIAEALYPYPEGVVVATKGGFERPGPDQWVENGRPAHLKSACEGSLRRLRLERIDLYQLHRIDSKIPMESQLGALKELQAEGKIKHIGLSEVSVRQLQDARAIVSIATVRIAIA